MIQLSKIDQKYVLACKGRLDLPSAQNVAEYLKPLFIETYGWDPSDDEEGFKWGLFNKLFDIYMLVRESDGYSNSQLKEVFKSAFHPRISRNHPEPIVRAITELYGQIQAVRIFNEDRTKRIDLGVEYPLEVA
jgi:hypothetical protein